MLCATVEGSLPIAGGVEAAYRAVIEAAPDRAARRAEIEAKLEALQLPMRTAEAFAVEEIIDPRRTRSCLTRFAGLAAPCAPPAGHISATGREYCDRLLGTCGKLRKALSPARGLCILSAT
jgi:hypothetical protein